MVEREEMRDVVKKKTTTTDILSCVLHWSPLHVVFSPSEMPPRIHMNKSNGAERGVHCSHGRQQGSNCPAPKVLEQRFYYRSSYTRIDKIPPIGEKNAIISGLSHLFVVIGQQRRPAISSDLHQRIISPAVMDLNTENRIASMLLEEARRLRAEADKEGVQAYLNKPIVRARPNSRFLTATVLGVQQANKAVEVNEMWRAREKEKELEDKLNKRSNNSRIDQEKRTNLDTSCSSRNYNYSNEDQGLRDDEIEEFLSSRRKRGRGEIGSRMDEPGPYLNSMDRNDEHLQIKERRIVGPEKPLFLKSNYSEDKISSKDKRSKNEKKDKDKRDEKKKRKEKRSKRHHKSRRREYDD